MEKDQQIIQLVVIADENNGIGKDNQLLAKMPADLKHFKQVTVGYPVIMGRKTFESMGNKALPGRRNIVVTRQDLKIEGCDVVHSISDAVNLCKEEEKISIIGGAEIFNQSVEISNKIELTRMHHTFEADTYFPNIENEHWNELSSEFHDADEKNPYAYTFITLCK